MNNFGYLITDRGQKVTVSVKHRIGKRGGHQQPVGGNRADQSV